MLTSTTPFLIAISMCAGVSNACGYYEFFEWLDLPQDVKEAAISLGYNEESWTSAQTAPTDFIQFGDLINGKTDLPTPVGIFSAKSNNILQSLATLDLYDEAAYNPSICWDFKVNHYNGYSWDETAQIENPFGDNIQEALQILGWTMEMWDVDTFDQGKIPESECTGWLRLEPEERWALRSLGWDAIAWVNSPADPRCSLPSNLFM